MRRIPFQYAVSLEEIISMHYITDLWKRSCQYSIRTLQVLFTDNRKAVRKAVEENQLTLMERNTLSWLLDDNQISFPL